MSSGLLVAADRLLEKLAAGPQFSSLSQIPARWLQKGVKSAPYTPPPTAEQTKVVAGQLGTPAHSAVVNQMLRNQISTDPAMATAYGKPETMQPIQLQPPKPNQHPFYGLNFFHWESPGPVIRGATDWQKQRWQNHLFENSEMGRYLDSPVPLRQRSRAVHGGYSVL